MGAVPCGISGIASPAAGVTTPEEARPAGAAIADAIGAPGMAWSSLAAKEAGAAAPPAIMVGVAPAAAAAAVPVAA